MWIVLHHWQDDDYKGIASGVHRVWVCADDRSADVCTSRVLRRMVRTRAAELPGRFEAWLKETGRPADWDVDDLEDPDATTDTEIDALHARLFQGEFIPGCTEWVSVMRPEPDA